MGFSKYSYYLGCEYDRNLMIAAQKHHAIIRAHYRVNSISEPNMVNKLKFFCDFKCRIPTNLVVQLVKMG